MVGELAYGMIAFAVGPGRLFRSQAFHGDIGGDEPVVFIVRSAQLLEQDAAQSCRSFVLSLRRHDREEEYEKQDLSHGILPFSGRRFTPAWNGESICQNGMEIEAT